MDLVLASRAAVELMGRPRRGESERVSTIGASRTIPGLDPMHREAARATLRSRLLHRRRSPPPSRRCGLPAAFEKTRHRSHLGPLSRPIRLYERTHMPAWQLQSPNSWHGLSDGKCQQAPSADHRRWRRRRPRRPNRASSPLMDFFGSLVRFRGALERPPTTPGAPSTAAEGMDGSAIAARTVSPGTGKGLTL